MDTLRGHFSDHGGPGDDGYDYDGGEDEIGREAPPSAIGHDERRMQVRAYNFWASLLADRNFPSVDDLDPSDLPDFGPYSVLLDFGAGIENPSIRFLGAALAEECGADGEIATLADVPARSLLSRITDHYLQIIANQAPIGFEAEFVNQRGSTILYRGILLPFSTDDETIDFIYGVINWKELADQKTTDELLLEIDQVLDVPPGLSLGGVPMGGWADGPAEGPDVLDLVVPADPADGDFDWPAPTFGSGHEANFDRSAPEEMRLADWLDSARQLAEAARGSEERTRHALYAAVGRAYDFSLAAARAPEEFHEMVVNAGLTAQERAPLTPLVKLVFGADYDKTRLTEYATVLAHAQRLALAEGSLAGFLADAPGGLKGIVNSERRLRRAETGESQRTSRSAPREALARKLRRLEPRSFADVPADGSEFTLLVVRRSGEGVQLLGEVAGDAALLERAARRLLR